MTSIGDKVIYVKSQGQTRNHHCHWPGCDKQVPPAVWGCRPHWYTLPQNLRDQVWRAYRPGQEVNGTPSAGYVAVARAVQEWIKEHQASKAPAPARQLGFQLADGPKTPTLDWSDATAVSRPGEST